MSARHPNIDHLAEAARSALTAKIRGDDREKTRQLDRLGRLLGAMMCEPASCPSRVVH